MAAIVVNETDTFEEWRVKTNQIAELADSSVQYDSSDNAIIKTQTVAPSLITNRDMSFQLVSNTQLKILVRGSDGVTRSTTLTLA